MHQLHGHASSILALARHILCNKNYFFSLLHDNSISTKKKQKRIDIYPIGVGRFKTSQHFLIENFDIGAIFGKSLVKEAPSINDFKL